MDEATAGWAIDVSSPDSAQASLAEWGDAWKRVDVVGVGWTARTVHELHVVAHGLVQQLVSAHGFRSVFVEGDWEASRALDAFVRDGTGDPRRTLADARSFIASEEMLDLVLWLRRFNEGQPAEPVRMVHGGSDDMSSPAALERSIAGDLVDWQQREGGRLIYLGGAAHVAAAPERVVTPFPAEPVTTAGAHLRARFGDRFRCVGLTFGSGPIPQPVPPPTANHLEATLDRLPHAATALTATDLAAILQGQPTPPDRVRLVGPQYDPTDDPAHVMLVDPTRSFDALIHTRTATPVTFLT